MTTYAKSCIPTSMFQPRLGLFTEFCMHKSCRCNNEPHDCNLKLVVPVSSFVQHCKFMLRELLLGFEKDGHIFGTSNCSICPSAPWKPYDRSTTKILLSEDIGVILVGSLKISSSSGRLQLHDGAGNIDVVVMDPPASTSASSIYEVSAVMSKSSSVFIEAVIFPWDLICTVTEGKSTPAKVDESRIFLEKHLSKRCKTGDTSWRELMPSMSDTSQEIPCQVSFRSASNHGLLTSGILRHAKGNKSSNISYKQSVKKLLLEFSSEWEQYNWLQIGSCYLMKHGSEDSFCFGQSGIFNNNKMKFRSESRVWSLEFSFDEVLTHDQYCPLVYEGLSGQPKEQRKASSSQPCSDVLLQLPYDAKRLFSIYLKDLEELIKPAEETSNASSCTWGAMTTGLSSQASFTNSLFPEGNLASFRGDVIAIDMVEHCVTGVSSNYCILVLVNGQTVKIFGSLSRHAYLTGFGPGVNATFYRVLAIRVENTFLLSPASFIKINSIKAIDDPYAEKLFHPSASCKLKIISQEKVSTRSISDVISGCEDNQPVSFVCKVLTVHLVILQKSLDKLSENRSWPKIDVPLAGFMVDDGSSTCLCWAKGKSASTFLRLHKVLPERAIDDDTWIRKDGSWSTIIFHLERIVEKHKRIVVKNTGSQVDTLFQDFTISVGSHHLLTDSEDKFLKFLILNPTNGPIWTVSGTSMDTETIGRVEREERVAMRTTKLPLPNIWATDVVPVDALAQANNLLQDLLNKKR